MRRHFEEQLTTLNEELTEMGAMCKRGIAIASKALTTGDTKLAEKAIPLDGEINQMERTIETLCLRLLLRQQPVARDLRRDEYCKVGYLFCDRESSGSIRIKTYSGNALSFEWKARFPKKLLQV